MTTAKEPTVWSRDTDILAEQIYSWGKSKGWYPSNDDNDFGTIIALIMTELGEAMESWRNHEEAVWVRDIDGKPEGWGVELADVLICTINAMTHYGVPVHQTLALKMAFNETRPYRHGDLRA